MSVISPSLLERSQSLTYAATGEIFLRGMIYSDETFDICPFCGNKLTKNKESYDCSVCRGQIIRKTCVNTKKVFYMTVINTGLLSKKARERRNIHSHINDRFAEAQYHYRNITAITTDGKNICPECGMIQE